MTLIIAIFTDMLFVLIQYCMSTPMLIIHTIFKLKKSSTLTQDLCKLYEYFKSQLESTKTQKEKKRYQV